MMTDIAGILKDKDNPESLIPLIDLNDAKALFEDGTISGGMIPMMIKNGKVLKNVER